MLIVNLDLEILKVDDLKLRVTLIKSTSHFVRQVKSHKKETFFSFPKMYHYKNTHKIIVIISEQSKNVSVFLCLCTKLFIKVHIQSY